MGNAIDYTHIAIVDLAKILSIYTPVLNFNDGNFTIDIPKLLLDSFFYYCSTKSACTVVIYKSENWYLPL